MPEMGENMYFFHLRKAVEAMKRLLANETEAEDWGKIYMLSHVDDRFDEGSNIAAPEWRDALGALLHYKLWQGGLKLEFVDREITRVFVRRCEREMDRLRALLAV